MPDNTFSVDFSVGQTTRMSGLRAGHTFESIVGETITLIPNAPIGTFTGSLRSAPAGSTAAWASNSFGPFDAPGRYQLTATDAVTGATMFDVVVFPAAAMTAPQVADANFPKRAPSTFVQPEPRSAGEIRMLLRRIASGDLTGQYSHMPTDEGFAALTPEKPIPDGLDLSAMGRYVLPMGH